MTTSNQMIKLISSDGKEFTIPRECALYSGTLRAMLEEDINQTEITIPSVNGKYLGKLIQYMYYKQNYSKASRKFCGSSKNI